MALRIHPLPPLHLSTEQHPHLTLQREHIEVPIERGAIALSRFTPPTPTRAPILLLHGFGMNRFTFHLQKRSLATFLAAAHYDVFLLELRGVGLSRHFRSRPATHIDDYILHDLPNAIRAACQRAQHPTAFLLGHSLGGLLSYATLPHMQAHIRGLITLSGVFSSLRNSHLLRWFSRLVRPAATPLSSFANVALPVELVGSLFERLLPLVDSRTAQRAMPVHAWYPGTIERPILKEHMRIGWDRSSLGTLLTFPRIHHHGELFSRNGKPYLERMTHIDRPLLVIGAEQDTLLAPKDAMTALHASRSSDKQGFLFGPSHGHPSPFGHLDMIIGHHAPPHIWSTLLSWLDPR